MTDLTARTERNKSVAAVVVTYNRKALLKECINALLCLKYDGLKVIIVDNASTDGTHEYVSDLVDGEQVVYIQTEKNLGGAGGFNLGIKEAMKAPCDYIWLMDDDCIVGENSLNALLSYANELNDKFGFLSSVVKWTDGNICEMNVQRATIWHGIGNFGRNGQRIILASFVSLFLNRAAAEKCGLPIKEFFIWGDDWEYTSRISKSFTNYLVPDSVVTHKCAINGRVDIVSAEADRLNRYFYAYRNEKYLFHKLDANGKLYYLLKIIYHKLKLLFVPHRKEKLAIMNKGLKAAKSFAPKIEFP